jgi:hypothetical protein
LQHKGEQPEITVCPLPGWCRRCPGAGIGSL